MYKAIVRALVLVLLLSAPVAAQQGVVTLGCASTLVNCVQVQGAQTGSSPTISAVGPDTNIGITITPKGTGVISWSGSSGMALSVTASSGLTSSIQTLAGDLTLSGTSIGHAGGYDGGVMGNVMGATTLTSGTTAGANTAGVIGKYSIAGTAYYRATGYPLAGVLGEASGRAHAGVMAAVSDSTNNTAVTIDSMYGVNQQFGYGSSVVNWGLNLQSANVDVYTARAYGKGDILLTNAVCWLTGTAAPTDGSSGTGAGDCGPGSIHTNTSDKKLRINTNTQASPTWTVVGTQS
jgi:hypothetical protein